MGAVWLLPLFSWLTLVRSPPLYSQEAFLPCGLTPATLPRPLLLCVEKNDLLIGLHLSPDICNCVSLYFPLPGTKPGLAKSSMLFPQLGQSI